MTDSAPVTREARDRALAQGVKWSAGARGIAQLTTWLSTLLVARLLSPADYGVASAATIYLGLLAVVSEFGLGTAVVSQRDLSPGKLAQLGGFAAVCGVSAWLLTFAVAPFVAATLGVAELRLVLPVLGFATALSTINGLPIGLLQKSLNFQAIAKADLLRAIGGALITLVLALAGFGFWALILGQVTAVALYSLTLYAFSPYRLAKPTLGAIRGSLGISKNVVVSRLAWFAYSNSDNAVIARALGKQSLGVYSMARTLTSIPAEKLSGVVMAVSTGLFASIQSDDIETRRYFLGLSETITFLLFPLTAGLAMVAPEAVAVLLGEQWSSAVPIVQMLAPVVAIRALGPVCSQVLLARLQARVEMRYTLASAIIYPLGFVLGVRYGLPGVAAAWLGLAPPMALWLLGTVCREIQLPLVSALRAISVPALCTVAMMLSVQLARSVHAVAALEEKSRLAVLCGVGAISYGILAGFTMRTRMRAMREFFRRT